MPRLFALIAAITASLATTACGGGDQEPDQRTCIVQGREMPAEACR